jgi:hypothetical protein
MSEARTFRLVSKDDALVARVVADIEHLVRHEHHDPSAPHPMNYKVVPPMTHDAKGFTRIVYLHTRSDEAAALARKGIADIAAMTCKDD